MVLSLCYTSCMDPPLHTPGFTSHSVQADNYHRYVLRSYKQYVLYTVCIVRTMCLELELYWLLSFVLTGTEML